MLTVPAICISQSFCPWALLCFFGGTKELMSEQHFVLRFDTCIQDTKPTSGGGNCRRDAKVVIILITTFARQSTPAALCTRLPCDILTPPASGKPFVEDEIGLRIHRLEVALAVLLLTLWAGVLLNLRLLHLKEGCLVLSQ